MHRRCSGDGFPDSYSSLARFVYGFMLSALMGIAVVLSVCAYLWSFFLGEVLLLSIAGGWVVAVRLRSVTRARANAIVLVVVLLLFPVILFACLKAVSLQCSQALPDF